MSRLQPYSWVDLHGFLRRWSSMGVKTIRIYCGPLTVIADGTIQTEMQAVCHFDGHAMNYGEVEVVRGYTLNRVLTVEHRPIHVGSWRWDERRYMTLRCFYELLRARGFTNISWEGARTPMYDMQHVAMLVQEEAFLRLKLQHGSTGCLYLQDLRSETYMKVFPDIVEWFECVTINQETRLTNIGTNAGVGDCFDDDGDGMQDLVNALPSSMDLGAALGFVSE